MKIKHNNPIKMHSDSVTKQNEPNTSTTFQLSKQRMWWFFFIRRKFHLGTVLYDIVSVNGYVFFLLVGFFSFSPTDCVCIVSCDSHYIGASKTTRSVVLTVKTWYSNIKAAKSGQLHRKNPHTNMRIAYKLRFNAKQVKRIRASQECMAIVKLYQYCGCLWKEKKMNNEKRVSSGWFTI